MNDISVTVMGTVGTDIKYVAGERGARATFRLASTTRFFSKSSQSWMDGSTTWLDVLCWRRLADNVASSLAKGDRVIVVGRLGVRTWEGDRGSRQSVEINAIAVGHDLNRGTSAFRKQRNERPESNEGAEGGTATVVPIQAATA